MMIDTNELTNMRGIALAAGVTDAAVCNWAARYDSFPAAIWGDTAGRTRIWLKSDVTAWVEATGRTIDWNRSTR